MAKITIAGDAVVITSAMTLEDISTIKKYCPKALILMGGEDGKDQVFAINVGERGDVNKYGVVFAKETRNDDKFATVTTTVNYTGTNIKEYVADKFGVVIANLNRLEATLPAVLEEIANEKAEIMNNITIAQ